MAFSYDRCGNRPSQAVSRGECAPDGKSALERLHEDCVKAFAGQNLSMDQLRREANSLTFYNAQGIAAGLVMGQVIAGAGTGTIGRYASRMLQQFGATAQAGRLCFRSSAKTRMGHDVSRDR